jgi:hypothetical protein
LIPWFDGGDNFVWIDDPFDGLEISVVIVEEAIGRGLEVDDGLEDSVFEPAFGEGSEETLNGIEPTMSGRFCSMPRAVLFARDLVAVKEASQRAVTCERCCTASAVLNTLSVISGVSSTSARMGARIVTYAHRAPVAPEPPSASRRPAPVPSSGSGLRSRRSLQNGSPPSETTGPTRDFDMSAPSIPAHSRNHAIPDRESLQFKAMRHALGSKLKQGIEWIIGL